VNSNVRRHRNVEPKSCVYCGSAPGVTADHVPPKAFFPRPRPSNLATVPACFACNNATSRDEEYFLAALMFSDAGVTTPGKQLWDEKLHRMYAKNVGLRRTIGRNLRPVQIATPAGIYLGRRMALVIDEPRLEAVAVKIVRGLHFLETGSPAPLDWDVKCLLLRERRHFDSVAQHNHMLHPGSRYWEGVFQYRRGAVAGDPLKSMWLLWFWRTHIFWITTQPAPVSMADDS
jgi:hypothetical protein